MTVASIDAETNKQNCLALIGWLRMGHFNPDPVRALLPHISDLNVADEDGITPLIAAVLLRDAKAVEMILNAAVAKPADINFITSENVDPDEEELIPIRLNDEAEEVEIHLPVTLKPVSYALQEAIKDDCKEMVDLLISRGARVNLKDAKIIQPLNVALSNNHPSSGAIFGSLCRAGADIFFNDPAENETPASKCFLLFGGQSSDLPVGTFSDRKEWLRHKLKTMMEFSRLDLNAKGSLLLCPLDDDPGKSALARIITHHNGSVDMADVMLDLGARVDVPDDNGETVYSYVSSKSGAAHPLKEKIQKRMQEHIAGYLAMPATMPVSGVSTGPRKPLRFTP